MLYEKRILNRFNMNVLIARCFHLQSIHFQTRPGSRFNSRFKPSLSGEARVPSKDYSTMPADPLRTDGGEQEGVSPLQIEVSADIAT